MDYVRLEVEDHQLVEEAFDPDGIEGSQAGNVFFFIQSSHCSTCPAFGQLALLVGVVIRMNTLVEVPLCEAALGLEL